MVLTVVNWDSFANVISHTGKICKILQSICLKISSEVVQPSQFPHLSICSFSRPFCLCCCFILSYIQVSFGHYFLCLCFSLTIRVHNLSLFFFFIWTFPSFFSRLHHLYLPTLCFVWVFSFIVCYSTGRACPRSLVAWLYPKQKKNNQQQYLRAVPAADCFCDLWTADLYFVLKS